MGELQNQENQVKASSNKIQIQIAQVAKIDQQSECHGQNDSKIILQNGTRIYEYSNEVSKKREYLTHQNEIRNDNSKENQNFQNMDQQIEEGEFSQQSQEEEDYFNEESSEQDNSERSLEEGEIEEGSPQNNENVFSAFNDQQLLLQPNQTISSYQQNQLDPNSMSFGQDVQRMDGTNGNHQIRLNIAQWSQTQHNNSEEKKGKRNYSKAFANDQDQYQHTTSSQQDNNSPVILQDMQSQQQHTSTTIRLNFANSSQNSVSKTTAYQNEIVQPESKRQKLSQENYDEHFNQENEEADQEQEEDLDNNNDLQKFEGENLEEKKGRDQVYLDKFNESVQAASFYNLNLEIERKERREHFMIQNIKKIQERNPLVQNHKSFLHSIYQPGLQFFNYMNNVQNMSNLNGMSGQRQGSGIQNYNLQQQQFRNKQYIGGGSLGMGYNNGSAYQNFNPQRIKQYQAPQQIQVQRQMQQMQTFSLFSHNAQKANQQNGFPFNPTSPNIGQNELKQQQASSSEYKNVSQIAGNSNQNAMFQKQSQSLDYPNINKISNGNFNSTNTPVNGGGQDLQNSNNSPLKLEMGGDSFNAPGNDSLQQNAINSSYQQNNSGNDFICITCHRGPPFTRKYAKNQCQTCYKKTKKYSEEQITSSNPHFSFPQQAYYQQMTQMQGGTFPYHHPMYLNNGGGYYSNDFSSNYRQSLNNYTPSSNINNYQQIGMMNGQSDSQRNKNGIRGNSGVHNQNNEEDYLDGGESRQQQHHQQQQQMQKENQQKIMDYKDELFNSVGEENNKLENHLQLEENNLRVNPKLVQELEQ